MTRPLCECHSEPMHQNGYEPTGTKKWRCAIGNRAHAIRWYDELDGVGYNRLLLRLRRNGALARMRRREEERGSLPREGRD